MARRHSRKSHSRKSHRRSKAHRRSHKHRRGSRKQQGGGSCAAMPLNRMNFQQQGGMAPMVAGDDYLLDAAARATAGVGSLDASFAELPSVIPRQAGGRRHRRSHKKSHRRSHKKSHRRSHTHRRGSRRQQRGGALAEMNGPSMLVSDMSKTGSNPQFLDEASVNPLYGVKGPQA